MLQKMKKKFVLFGAPFLWGPLFGQNMLNMPKSASAATELMCHMGS